jgi:uncharacterized Zn finger protein
VTDWSGPFIAVFESLRMAPRFARGRRDARAGHVRSLSISSSLVTAQVRAPDEAAAQRARIAVRAFGASQWATVERHLATQARYAAALLAGRMPDDIEAVFASLDLPLLPETIGDVAMDCTCGHWSMPCSHLAATCYALARSFDSDPFGILAWRGRSRDELLLRLRDLRSAPAPAPSTPAPEQPELDVAAFWSAPPVPPPTSPPTLGVARSDALLDELGPLALDADGVPVVDLLRPLYRALGG